MKENEIGGPECLWSVALNIFLATLPPHTR